MIDTGASRSIISSTFFHKFSKGVNINTIDLKLETVTGEELLTEGQADIAIDNIGVHKFIIVPNLKYKDIILGQDFCSKFSVNLDFDKRVARIKSRYYRFDCSDDGQILPDSIKLIKVAEIAKPTPSEWMGDIANHVVFREEIGHCTAGIPITIRTEGGPIRLKPYRQALTKRRIVEDEIEKLLKAGIIRPSQSPWGSPITLVPKKSGETRFCIDYRKVNSITIRDAYPIPLIQEIFDSLGGSKYFTTLDLRSGYWQVDVDEESIPKTAFTCHKGAFEFVRLPMGLKNSASQFQRVMNAVLSKFIGHNCLVYIDDIIVYSKTKTEHNKHVREILDCINEAGLTLKLSKCEFGKTSVNLLGYVVSDEGVQPQDEKVEAIRNVPAPKTVKEIRSFLGLTGYYRQCIDSYASISEPLVRLTKKNEPFIFGEEQSTAFQRLKEALCSETIMAYPQVDKPYNLYTDASNHAIGAILVQKDANGVERVIQYVSKQLTEPQKSWSAIEREAFALVFALRKLRPYLQGAEFTVYTDHKPLKSLFCSEIKNTKIQRWASQISDFGCAIEYRKGKNNIRADMLSRIRPSTEVIEIGSLNDIIREGRYREQEHEFSNQWREAATDESDDYIIENGELYSTILPYQNALEHPRLLLPEAHRTTVIHEAHLEVGHRSVFNTLRRVQNFCVWPGMRKDIREYIDHCAPCQGNRGNERPTPLQVTDTPTAPFQKIGIDLTGPFLPSPNGNKYLLTIVDHFSGWAEAYPITDKRSASVWQPLYSEFFCRFGFPNVLVTDQGTEFNSTEMREGLRRLSIEHRRTSPYHPQTNGCVERFNRSLKDTLRKLVNNDTSAWETQLPEALLAYRMAESQSRNSSPYFALFGMEPNVDPPTHINEHRFENLARAKKLIYESQHDSKVYRHNKSADNAKSRDFRLGQYVTIKTAEPITLSHLRDHSLKVVSVRGKVIGVQPLNSTEVRYYNIDRLRVVPEDISWSDINPRRKRYRGPSDVRTLNNVDQEQYEVTHHEPTRIIIRKKRKATVQSGTSNHKRFRPFRKRPVAQDAQSVTKRVRVECFS